VQDQKKCGAIKLYVLLQQLGWMRS